MLDVAGLAVLKVLAVARDEIAEATAATLIVVIGMVAADIWIEYNTAAARRMPAMSDPSP